MCLNVLPNDYCTNYSLIPSTYFAICTVVWLAGAPVTACSLPSLHTQTYTHPATSFCTPVKMGTLPFPSLWMPVVRTRGKIFVIRFIWLHFSSQLWQQSLPHLLPLPGGERDALGLDPAAEAALAGPSTQEGCGDTVRSPLPAQPSRSWVQPRSRRLWPRRPLPSSLLGHSGSPWEHKRTRMQERRETVTGGHSAAQPEEQQDCRKEGCLVCVNYPDRRTSACLRLWNPYVVMGN